MRLSSNVLQALAALTICLDTQTIAISHRGIKHARPRGIDTGVSRTEPLQRRSINDTTQITLAQIQILEGYATTYHLWMNQWFSQQPTSSSLLAELHQQYKQYDNWINAWMARAMDAISEAADTGVAAGPSSPAVASFLPMISGSSPAQAAAITAATATAVTSSSAVDLLPSVIAETPPSQAAKASVTKGATSSPSSILPSTLTTQSNASVPSPFNPDATNNIAAYWGSGALGTKIGLNQICMDPDVNIVVLAFLIDFNFMNTTYPKIDFSGGCGGQTPEQTKKNATGLLHCVQMAAAIRNCQSKQKKVLLSIGGAMGSAGINLASDDQANSVAEMLWDLFGGGNASVSMRPFGRVKLDGFDVDDENKLPAHWTTLVKTLKSKFAGDTSKSYYISAAPQCPAPDASIPIEAMQVMDFVWVQFYNNPLCNLNTTGFGASFSGWSSNLSAKGAGPRLFIGAPGCEDTTVDPNAGCAGSGYVEPSSLSNVVAQVKGTKNLGGMMLWDASRAYMNNHYAHVAKEALS